MAFLIKRGPVYYIKHYDNGKKSRISTGTGLIDFSREDVDIGIRYGRGQWSHLVAERLVGEDIMPVCAPSLVKGPTGLKKPVDLKRFKGPELSRRYSRKDAQTITTREASLYFRT